LRRAGVWGRAVQSFAGVGGSALGPAWGGTASTGTWEAAGTCGTAVPRLPLVPEELGSRIIFVFKILLE